MVILSEKLSFPDPRFCSPDGLVAIGGDLSIQRLLLAYKNGIFPWETDPVIAWYSPDPRCILYPEKVVVSKSMRSIIHSGKFKFQVNTSFRDVIYNCKNNKRKETTGSWISEPLIQSFVQLHELGYAVSFETWMNKKLVGGLYGLRLGSVFFGESMFSLVSNASKYALINMCTFLQQQNISVVDCQVHSEHLESMGVILISRKEFLNKLKKLT